MGLQECVWVCRSVCLCDYRNIYEVLGVVCGVTGVCGVVGLCFCVITGVWGGVVGVCVCRL